MLTKPQISSVESFVFTPSEARLASAFFATQTDKNTQKIAIENGAYAIIFAGKCEILSDEIAYICVENLTRAIIELTKYFANEKELKFICLSPFSAQIACISNLIKFGTFLNDDVRENFVKIFSALNKSFVFSENLDSAWNPRHPWRICKTPQKDETVQPELNFFAVQMVSQPIYSCGGFNTPTLASGLLILRFSFIPSDAFALLRRKRRQLIRRGSRQLGGRFLCLSAAE